ncbi:hypothetical protein NUM3379_34950 [Kineococcus sp. NUM-3379]
MPDVLVLGATGRAGGQVTARLMAEGHSLTLAARDSEGLARVSAKTPQAVRSVLVELSSGMDVRSIVRGHRVVVNAVGPFTTLAPEVIDACIAEGVSYVDLANELPAVEALLARAEEAAVAEVCLVTGAGFGVVATECLVRRLAKQAARPIAEVRTVVLAVGGSGTAGVEASKAELMRYQSARYVGGALVREPLGSGATTFSIGGIDLPVLRAPMGDLAAAWRATGADASAYVPDPRKPLPGRGASGQGRTYVEVVDVEGEGSSALLTVQDLGEAAWTWTAAVVGQVLEGAPAGAWTPAEVVGGESLLGLADVQVAPVRGTGLG